MYPGAYKNFDDLEEYLTRDELLLMYEKAHELRLDEKRFAAALKGIDIDEGKKSEGQDIIDRAMAKANGNVNYELDNMFEFIEEDE